MSHIKILYNNDLWNTGERKAKYKLITYEIWDNNLWNMGERKAKVQVIFKSTMGQKRKLNEKEGNFIE